MDVTFTSLAAGDEHTCGILDNGLVKCWGADGYGQSTPPKNMKFTSLTAGDYFTCGIRAGDRIEVCWGTYVRNL